MTQKISFSPENLVSFTYFGAKIVTIFPFLIMRFFGAFFTTVSETEPSRPQHDYEELRRPRTANNLNKESQFAFAQRHLVMSCSREEAFLCNVRSLLRLLR